MRVMGSGTDQATTADRQAVGMTSRSRRTQAERRAMTRTALLGATIEVLADVGYARLTTAAVCARAGVTRGAQAHHFATKADLVVQALLHLTEEMVEDLLTTRIPSTAGVRAQYAALLDRLWEIFSARQADAHLQLLVTARTDDELRRHLVAFDRRVARTLADAAERVAPDLVRRDGFKPLMNTALATIRGLRLLRAVTSERQVRAHWPAARDHLLAAQPVR
jgi:AcrR family transcriptional regulator